MIIEITCPNCNFSKKVPQEKIPDGIKLAKCPRCGNTFNINPVDDPSDLSQEKLIGNPTKTEGSESAGKIIDEEAGYFTVLLHTFKGALFSPVKFFREKRQEETIGQSFAFGVLTGSLGAMFGIFWQFILNVQEFSSFLRVLPDAFTLNRLFLAYIIISPFLVMFFMFLTTAVFHCCLFILGGATRGFGGTFKACAYSNAASVFNLIPYIGWLIKMIWGLVIMVIGFREIHETTSSRAVFALLIPFLILVIIGIFLGFVAAIYLTSQLM